MDLSADLQQHVIDAYHNDIPLEIIGGGSKRFFGRTPSGEPLHVADHCGIIDYQPGELTLTARGGTPLAEIANVLSEHGQMLPFEPPGFDDQATLAGTVACALAGPRQPWTGNVRDYLLAVRVLTGSGRDVRFGAPVVKNVAGYDLFRPMAGALGTLGVLLEITLKLLPAPSFETSLATLCSWDEASDWLHRWQRASIPLSGACHHDGRLAIRLSGPESSIDDGIARLGIDMDPVGNDIWADLNEQRLAFFDRDAPLYRLHVPPAACLPDDCGNWLIDRAGQQRWLYSGQPFSEIQGIAAEAGGHACLFRGGNRDGEVFPALPGSLMDLHRRVRQVMDPKRILNRGRLYRD